VESKIFLTLLRETYTYPFANSKIDPRANILGLDFSIDLMVKRIIIEWSKVMSILDS
jgi:hypothetical protein